MTQTFQSHNPATLEVVWQGIESGQKEIDRAFECAYQAFETWSNLSIQERIAYLHKYKEKLTHSRQLLAETISVEMGKPLWESFTEVTSMINKVDISIQAYEIRCLEIKQPQASYLATARHKPHGVVVVLGPYNFPGHLPNGHIVPALLAGNTVIFKPSELTPLVGELMGQCWLETGLPPGIFNIVQGGSQTGRLLASHPKINGLFFTGSWAVGQSLLKQFGEHPEKILALEMGGNNPLVFHEVKNIEAAAYYTLQSAFITSGQRCTCARRLIVVDGEHSPAFIRSLEDQIRQIMVGPYNQQPEPFMGPLISEKAAQKLMDAQNQLISRGGIPKIPMQMLKPGTGFLSPGLIDVSEILNRPDEELFGPFLQLIRVPTFEAALKEANHTAYGLAAGLLSDKPELYKRFYQSVKAGIINWNTQLTGASSTVPFGGIGHSGNFRPSAFYAADYCSYPVASLEAEKMQMPEKIAPGLLNPGKK